MGPDAMEPSVRLRKDSQSGAHCGVATGRRRPGEQRCPTSSGPRGAVADSGAVPETIGLLVVVVIPVKSAGTAPCVHRFPLGELRG